MAGCFRPLALSKHIQRLRKELLDRTTFAGRDAPFMLQNHEFRDVIDTLETSSVHMQQAHHVIVRDKVHREFAAEWVGMLFMRIESAGLSPGIYLDMEEARTLHELLRRISNHLGWIGWREDQDG